MGTMELPDGVRRAAVVVPIVAEPAPTVLFIRRAAHLRRNADQVAFPGGLADDADGEDLRVTALREYGEEVGADPGDLAVVHRLPDALVVNKTVLVTPFVAVAPERPKLTLDALEVAAAFFIPFAAIAAPGAVHQGVEVFEGRAIPAWQFDWSDVHVWGATARILRLLLVELENDDAFRVALGGAGIATSPYPPDRAQRRSET
jgi:8-oxo-dGTP pyrophosphatase MutT (NUDIX family)